MSNAVPPEYRAANLACATLAALYAVWLGGTAYAWLDGRRIRRGALVAAIPEAQPTR